MIDDTAASREDQGLDFSPDRVADRIAKRMAVPVQPPKDFRVERAGSSLRLVAIDRGRFISAQGQDSGADRYLFFWAESVNDATKDGIDAGFARATKIGDVLRAFIEDKELTFELGDGKFQTGYFYAVGSNPLGDISEYIFSGKQTSEIVDDTIPSNVTDLSFSESGETHNGVVVSAVAFQYDAPVEPSFAGVLFVLEDYPNIGEVTEYYTDTFIGPPRGRSTGKFTALPCRRVGAGLVSLTNGNTAVTGAGTAFTKIFKTGDLIEVLGVQGTVTVNSDTSMTLAANWTGPTVAAFADWLAIGKVTVYAVPLSKAGTHRPYTAALSSRFLFDAELSAPLAPSLSLVELAGGIRVYATPPAGTQIDSIVLYKGKGSGLAFSATSQIYTWTQDKINASPFLEYPDLDFTIYDKEQATKFSYYAVAVNVRGAQSAPSTRVEYQARLQSSQDTDPTLVGRVGLKQLLYNAMFAGAAGNVVDTDTVQDSALNTDASNLPGRPYGGSGQLDGTGRFRGYSRWHSTKTAGAPTLAQFQNNAEVKLPAPTAGNVVYLFQEIGSWDDGRTAFMKVKKNAVMAFSVFAKYSGSQPTGGLHVLLEQYNNNAFTAWAPRRYRDSSSNLQLVDVAGGSTNELVIPGSSLTTSWQRWYAIFVLYASLGTTKQLRCTFSHNDSVAGGDIILCQPEVNEGEELGFWTADMGDTTVSYPGTNSPPQTIGDGDGRRDGKILQP